MTRCFIDISLIFSFFLIFFNAKEFLYFGRGILLNKMFPCFFDIHVDTR